jgi:hypothetical protein
LVVPIAVMATATIASTIATAISTTPIATIASVEATSSSVWLLNESHCSCLVVRGVEYSWVGHCYIAAKLLYHLELHLLGWISSHLEASILGLKQHVLINRQWVLLTAVLLLLMLYN